MFLLRPITHLSQKSNLTSGKMGFIWEWEADCQQLWSCPHVKWCNCSTSWQGAGKAAIPEGYSSCRLGYWERELGRTGIHHWNSVSVRSVGRISRWSDGSSAILEVMCPYNARGMTNNEHWKWKASVSVRKGTLTVSAETMPTGTKYEAATPHWKRHLLLLCVDNKRHCQHTHIPRWQSNLQVLEDFFYKMFPMLLQETFFSLLYSLEKKSCLLERWLKYNFHTNVCKVMSFGIYYNYW